MISNCDRPQSGKLCEQKSIRLATTSTRSPAKQTQAVIATHVDKAHIHSHIVFNSVNAVTGKMYHSTRENYYRQIRGISDWLCKAQELHDNDICINHKTVQKLYLSPIIDLFNGEVVIYNLSRRPDFKQITDMLENAFQKLPDKVDDLILHSDQGWQYQMKAYQRMLKAKGITQSISRKVTCLDNAVAENFFGLLKTELLYLEEFDSIDQFEKAIVEYIDYYNNRRIKLKLNGLSPVQYRIQTVHVA